MLKNKTELLAEVAEYYTTKLAKYGKKTGYVNWNGENGQTLRSEQLCKIVDTLINSLSMTWDVAMLCSMTFFREKTKGSLIRASMFPTARLGLPSSFIKTSLRSASSFKLVLSSCRFRLGPLHIKCLHGQI